MLPPYYKISFNIPLNFREVTGDLFALTAYENSSYIAEYDDFENRHHKGYLKCHDLNGLTYRSKFRSQIIPNIL